MPTRSILLHITHDNIAPGSIQGFRYFWAYYVNGYNPTKHCQPCFNGRRVAEFCSATAESGCEYVFDLMHRYPYLYICGVGRGPRHTLGGKNFHLALRHEEGAASTHGTYNGYSVAVQNAVALPIPELPVGWNGRDLETTRCKNFRFAVEYFGYPPRATIAS